MGILEKKDACIYPGMESELKGAKVVYEKVVRAGNIITARGMGAAIAFGLEIVAALINRNEANILANTIVYEN
jgi:4-methyl-5(b-hydroxyethyl)-thiazole monophosphate biosynthesis